MPVKVENITKLYGKQKALDQVSFEFNDGELVGFLGPNGAGKSTLMKIITGYLAPDVGELRLNGERLTPENYLLRKQIGYLPEHNPLYPDLYVKEYLNFAAGFYKLPNKNKKIAEVIEMTGLGLEQHKKIGALSKGYRQRVGLAQALVHDPSVLILDEPTTGLDPNQLEEIRSLIREISHEKTVLFSSHIMQEVEAICTRVVIINRGKLIADGPINHLKIDKVQQVLVEFDCPINPTDLKNNLPINEFELVNPNLGIAFSTSNNDLRPLLFDYAVKNSFKILSMNEQQASLEDVFQRLTQAEE